MPRKTAEEEMATHYAHTVRSFQLTAPPDTGPYVAAPMSATPPRPKAYMLHLPDQVRVHEGTTREICPSIMLRGTVPVRVTQTTTPVRVHLTATTRKRLTRATTKAMAGVDVLIGGFTPTPIEPAPTHNLPIGMPHAFLYFAPCNVLPKRERKREPQV